MTRTPCRSRAIRAGHAYQPSTYRTYLRHRAACPGRGASSTNAVLVPASGVLYEPRRQRRKEKEKKKSGKGKKEKKEKKAKQAKKAKKEKKKRKRDKAPVERSIVTGKTSWLGRQPVLPEDHPSFLKSFLRSFLVRRESVL